MTNPVTAIVLNWNREHDTAECLDSFLAQRGATVEILLVDNASADGSGDRLHARYPAIEYLQTGSNLGYAGANNRAMERALARGAAWVLVVNNDTVADPDCVRRLLDALRADPGLGAVAPHIGQFGRPGVSWFEAGRLSVPRGIGVHVPAPAAAAGGVAACTFLSGCCVLFRGDALRQVGLFREDFWAYVEDAELSLRLTRAGWRLGVVRDARLDHKAPPVTVVPGPNQIRLRDRNRRRMVRDLFPLHHRLAFAAWFWPTRLALVLLYLSHGEPARARAVVQGMVER